MRLIGYLERNGLDASSYRLSLWRKLIAPLTVVAMMLLAVPFVLGSQRGGGDGQRLLVGILVGLVFYVINEEIGRASCRESVCQSVWSSVFPVSLQKKTSINSCT